MNHKSIEDDISVLSVNELREELKNENIVKIFIKYKLNL
jgi:hypothetical protein